MKILNLTIFTIICILTVSCSRDKDSEPDVSNVKIASISGIGSFTYANNKLVSIGNEHFYYGANGKLSASRIYQIDTSKINMQVVGEPNNPILIERLEKSSYIWQNGRISTRVIDTLQTKSYRSNGSANLLEPVNSYSLSTNFVAENFFYKNGMLDSLSRLEYSNQSSNSRVKFFYNQEGDLVKIIEKAEDFRLPIPYTAASTAEIEIAYDNKPNPFYHLFKRTGVILNQVKRFYVSPHNPISIKSKIAIQGQTPIVVERLLSYEYDKKGFPVKIKQHNPLGGEQVISISYQ